MIKVIIADDEKRICTLITKLINWDDMEMDLVGTANNGIETIELIKSKKADIVITDIRMPGYDGLEMIERAKKINKDLEFIIISGYSHFEYAKKAINYEVKDYLLKPINQDEFNQHGFILMSVIEGEGVVKIDGDIYPVSKGNHFILSSNVSKYIIEGILRIIVSYL